jgi:RNA polymerase sigma-70 factor (ECF subfamily)
LDLLETQPAPEDGRGEDALVEALRMGDESEFAALVRRLGGPMLRVATSICGDRVVGEDVVQETWVAVVKGLDGFEGRSTLKTWIFSVLVRRAASVVEREGRSVPFTALASAEVEAGESPVEIERFLPADHARWPHHWASPPRPWGPSEQLGSAEVRREIESAVEDLARMQRAVITLRDLTGFTAAETCRLLEMTEGNQRVLLHRARSRVRRRLERYFAGEQR